MLTTRYMQAWVRGLQQDPNVTDNSNRKRALQALATCKHWSSYSLEGQIKATAAGPPANYPGRHQFDAVVSKQDLMDFYFPVFESCVRDSGVASVMCSYNSVSIDRSNGTGIPSCANAQFNDGILRGKWGFSGLLVSDCTAISDFTEFNSKCKPHCLPGHNYSSSNISAVAAAITGGTASVT